MQSQQNISLAVIGLGYVGLPLAVAFGKLFQTVGFDLKRSRIEELRSGTDSTREVEPDELQQAVNLSFSDDLASIKNCNHYVIAVPTPIDQSKRPDLRPLQRASELVGSCISEGDIVIYESTVYPGATEEVCVPILESQSGLVYNKDFYCGYSPERINPGDKEHRLADIIKVTSGSTPAIARRVDEVYKTIVTAGTFLASSIKVAEAAKVIENTQRDVNIALINELALIFNKLDINTAEVLEAAGTKWNFLPFTPGLVGGHCIGVDPYYLTHKAQEVGYHPSMILAGRRLNDNMGKYIASQVIKLMLQKQIEVSRARILVMGLTFKENCPDLRNTKVIDIISEFIDYGINVDVYDPWVDIHEAKLEYGINVKSRLNDESYDALVLAVAHSQFEQMGIDDYKKLVNSPAVIFDVKNLLPSDQVDGTL